MGRDKDIPDPQRRMTWPDLPLYERNPTATCASCAYLVRLRMDPTDLVGKFVCKRDPPAVTSAMTSTGQIIGMAQPFMPESPGQWCFQWQPRDLYVPRGTLAIEP